MTIDEIKAKALAFLKTAKEKICDFFEPVNNALFGKAEQKREDAESASKKNADADSDEKREKIFSENVQNENDESKTQATEVSAGTKAKSYISIFADFVASLFYVAVVVLVLKPSLLNEKALIRADKVYEKINEEEKITKVLDIGEKIFKIEITEIKKDGLTPEKIKKATLALLFFYAGLFILVYLLGKIICICFSAVPFRKIVPFLLVLLQVLCLMLFKYNYGWLLFISFSLLLYIAFQTAVGCTGVIIKKKLKFLIVAFIIGYILANIIFVKEVQDCLRELVSLLRPMI